MRISDWSSDVCSSDLPVEARSSLGNRSVIADQEYLLQVWQIGFDLGDPRDQRRRDDQHARPAQTKRVRQERSLIRIADRYLDRTQLAQRKPRSEEHTSELQSLMRISYAVFCLKKKIIQKN